jgi:taurine dioxygenase
MDEFGGLAVGLQLGNLGFKIKGVSAQQVLDDAAYFHQIFKRNKVVGFIRMHPTDVEQMEITQGILSGKTDRHFRSGLLVDQSHKTLRNTLDTSDPEEFLRANWHIDNPFLPSPPCAVSIHMTRYRVDPRFGHTFFVSLSNMYQDCPEELKPNLATARFTSMIKEDSVSHPALRTHPETGETMLHWLGAGTTLVEGDPAWMKKLSSWVGGYLADPAHRFRWEWKEGDLLIWDNRAVLHGFYNGWENEDRVFQRVEVGAEQPYYDPTQQDLTEANRQALGHPGRTEDKSIGPNPDHIPLVFTKGISALEGLDHLYQKVVVVSFAESGASAERVNTFMESFKDDDYADDLVLVRSDPTNTRALWRYMTLYKESLLPKDNIEDCVFLFGRNGDLHGAFGASYDLFNDRRGEDGKPPPIERVKTLLRWRPDLRHAGHAWHYPDWFPHQQLKFRPWDYHNLSFHVYEQFGGQKPPEDWLVQFAIDTVYACFNHLEESEDRLRVITRIRDYIDFMVDLREHEHDR